MAPDKTTAHPYWRLLISAAGCLVVGAAFFMLHAELAFGAQRRTPEHLDIIGAYAILIVTGLSSCGLNIAAFYRWLACGPRLRFADVLFVLLSTSVLYCGLICLYAVALFERLL